MTSALVLSRMFPRNEQMVHGLFQRLGTQIEALGRVADRIDCLFLVEDDLKLSAEQINSHRDRLSRQWATNINLIAAPVLHEQRQLNRWLQFGAGIFDFHRQPIAQALDNPEALSVVASALRAGPDLVLAHRLSAMSGLLRLKSHARGLPVFFDLDDIEHRAATRRLIRKPDWQGERLKLLQIPRLLLSEVEAIRLSRRTFVCSQADYRYLARFVGPEHLEVVPNSVRFPELGDEDRSDAEVLFVGSMTYRPNAIAAETLVRDIWPKILAQVPNARLVIAGMRPDLVATCSSPPPSVTFAGFVDDLSELYAKARVVCCPIAYGSGTRVKIIEAAAYARAVICTSLAAEGLDFVRDSEIIIRNDPTQLAQECVRLLKNPEEARRIGAAARERARRGYDRRAIVAQLEQIFRDALRQPQP